MKNDFDSYDISRALGRGNEISDQELLTWFERDMSMDAARRLEIDLLVTRPPWLELVTNMYQERVACARPLTLPQDLLMQLEQARAEAIQEWTSGPQNSRIESHVQRVLQGVASLTSGFSMVVRWKGALPALSLGRSFDASSSESSSVSESVSASSAYMLEVPELEQLGWNPTVLRNSESLGEGRCRLIFSFSRPTNLPQSLRFILCLEDGTQLGPADVKRGILTFDVKCEQLPASPTEVLVYSPGPNEDVMD